MFFRSLLLASFACLLAACGSGGGGGSSVETLTVGAGALTPVYPANTLTGTKTERAELENGLVVYLGHEDGTVAEYRLRIDRMGTPSDATDDVLFVERNGGAAVTYEPIVVSGEDGTVFSLSGTAENGDFIRLSVDEIFATTDSHPYVLTARTETSSGGLNLIGRGAGGLETAVSDLPDSADYVGEYTLTSAESSFEIIGGLTMRVDFANGQVSGTHDGLFDGPFDTGRIEGDVEGAVSGSRLAGTMTVTGDTTGALDFAGMVFGPDGERIGLGIAGTAETGGGVEPIGGSALMHQGDDYNYGG
ncbi:MAG: hypothetical protein AAFY06_10550 [Pseudomonadota bacterium]